MNKTQLTISSIEMQKFQKIYALSKAFMIGTIFEELDKPWSEKGW